MGKNWLNLDLNEDFISKHGWFDQEKTWGLGFSPDFAMKNGDSLKWIECTSMVHRPQGPNPYIDDRFFALDDPCLNLRFASLKLMCCPFRDFLGEFHNASMFCKGATCFYS